MQFRLGLASSNQCALSTQHTMGMLRNEERKADSVLHMYLPSRLKVFPLRILQIGSVMSDVIRKMYHVFLVTY